MSGKTPKKLTYISVFSGIEAASVAWEPLGFEPAAFAEVDAFPSAILKERYPHVPNLGDITKIDWSGYHGKTDIVVGGSPCQSFSIAGKREGLAGASGLMYEYIRAVREIMPRYFVWENVPGALSSEKGEAFRQLLAEMDGLGYGLAWRILDAQFFGVAQRRRRVFLVGSLGDNGASEVLFEPDCLHWDTASSREKREELARAAEERARSSYTMLVRCGKEGGEKGALVQDDVSATLSCANVQTLFQPAVCLSNGEDTVSALCARDFKGVGSQYVSEGKVMCMASGQANAEIVRDMTPAQAARQYKDPQIVCFNSGNANDVAHIGEAQSQIAPSLRASRSDTNGTPAVCTTQYGSELAGTLMAKGDSSPCHDKGANVISDGYIVRRLTPTECERLQGFPDGWTKVAYRGKSAEDCPDTPRYKALGNTMAVPVMRWIGERILRADRLAAQAPGTPTEGGRHD